MSVTVARVLVTDRKPKRVILRLRYNEFKNDDSSYKDAIEVYLTSIGRKVDEIEEGRHAVHVETRQDYMEGNPKASFHVTLDMEKDKIREPDINELTHEIHRIRRENDGTL